MNLVPMVLVNGSNGERSYDLVLKWTPSQGQKRTNYQWAHGFTQAFGCEAAGRISAGEQLSSPKLKSAPQGAEVCHSSGVW